MKPRGGFLTNGSIKQTLDAYLSWKHEPTPLISFFASWERVLRWRDWLIRKRGARDVVIVAVWLKGRPEIYDGHAAAVALGYAGTRLQFHVGEFLLHGGIKADENRILACMPGNASSVEEITLLPFPLCSDLQFRTTIPTDALPDFGGNDRTKELKNETEYSVGFPNDMTFCALALSMCGQDWKLVDDRSRVTFIIPSPRWNQCYDFTYWFNPCLVDDKKIRWK